MGSGIIISEAQPELTNRYTWCRPLPDGGKEWYEPADGGWVLVRTDAAPALLAHSHPTHGNINFTGTVSADGSVGLTGQKTLGGYVFTFKKGLLTGFVPV